MKTGKTTGFFALLLATLLLSACGPFNRTYPQKNYYAFPAGTVQAAGPVNGPVVRIGRFSVSPAFQDKFFVYRVGDFRYETDYYNELLTTPDKMFKQAIGSRLEAAGLFSMVSYGQGTVLSDYAVEGNISGIYGDFRTPEKPGAVLAVQLFLLDTRKAESKIILARDYNRTVDLADASPDTLFGAWSDSLDDILSDFISSVRGLHLKKTR